MNALRYILAASLSRLFAVGTSSADSRRAARDAFGIAALAFTLMLGSCSDSDITPGEPTEKKTAIIYISAQNSLAYYVTSDVLEIVKGAPLLKDGETVVVYLDRDEGTEIYAFDRNHTALTPRVTFGKNLDSSDPATMAKVLQWVKENYPAADYGLTLWSHADGWLPPLNTDYQSAKAKSLRSIGIDDGGIFDKDQGTSLAIEDLAQVLANSGMKFRYMLFDACLMQSLEVDYALRNVTDYIIASPISTNSDGAYYTHQLTQGMFSDDPVDIARTYYKDVENMETPAYWMGIVVSAVKTSGLDSLATLTRELLQKNDIQYPMTDGLWTAAGNEWQMDNVQAYAPYMAHLSYKPDFFDAAAVMRKMLPAEDAERWCRQLDECVVYKAGTKTFYVEDKNKDFCYTLEEGFCAVSMFVPQKKHTDNATLCPYGDLNKVFTQTKWAHAIDWTGNAE